MDAAPPRESRCVLDATMVSRTTRVRVVDDLSTISTARFITVDIYIYGRFSNAEFKLRLGGSGRAQYPAKPTFPFARARRCHHYRSLYSWLRSGISAATNLASQIGISGEVQAVLHSDRWFSRCSHPPAMARHAI